MSIVVDQSLVERVLAILRDSDDYESIRRDLDEYFHQESWVDTATSDGPFALAFTLNQDEGGWLAQGELAAFWHAVELADPRQPSDADALHQLLREMIAGWRTASPDPAGSEQAGFQSVSDMSGANYAGWQQGYDPEAQVWKYRDPRDGLWREGHEAFPAVAPGSRIFRIGAATFRSEGDGERQVWPHPDVAGTYYDATDSYDLLGNVIVANAKQPAADATAADAGEPVDEAALEQELRELFDIPPDWPVWVSQS